MAKSSFAGAHKTWWVSFVRPHMDGSDRPAAARRLRSSQRGCLCFVFATPSVSVVRLRLLMIPLAKESIDEGQMQSAVGLIPPRFLRWWQFCGKPWFRYKVCIYLFTFLYVCRGRWFDVALTEIFIGSVAIIL
jgi:hypothetical protein